MLLGREGTVGESFVILRHLRWVEGGDKRRGMLFVERLTLGWGDNRQ